METIYRNSIWSVYWKFPQSKTELQVFLDEHTQTNSSAIEPGQSPHVNIVTRKQNLSKLFKLFTEEAGLDECFCFLFLLKCFILFAWTISGKTGVNMSLCVP